MLLPLESILGFSALDDDLGPGRSEGIVRVGQKLFHLFVHSVLRVTRWSGGIQRR